MTTPPSSIEDHNHVFVMLYNFNRDPRADEPGFEWIDQAQPQRACLLGSETAIILAGYLRTLGYQAKAHTGTTTDIDLNKAAVAAGLARIEDGKLVNPFVGERFGLVAITTTFEMACDQPLAPSGVALKDQLAWQIGYGSQKNALTLDPYAKRDYASGAHPFETLKRVDKPTTYIDEERIPRVPKRADMFARSQFGDMGKANQEAATGGYFAQKAPISRAIRRPLGAFVLLQNGPSSSHVSAREDSVRADTQAVKAVSYFLGAEADVQRLRDLEVRQPEMHNLPPDAKGRIHVWTLYEDLPLERRGSATPAALALDRDQRARHGGGSGQGR